jgi:hypothetical protein
VLKAQRYPREPMTNPVSEITPEIPAGMGCCSHGGANLA